MKIKLRFIFFISIISFGGEAQITFQKTFGGLGFDVSNCVQQTSDSGYVLVGQTNSFGTGNDDVYLIKTNMYGDTLWTKTYGGTGYETGRSVQQTNDGGYIVCAGNSNYSTGVRLLKTNSIGDTIWTRTFDGGGFSVQQTPDSGYIMTGARIWGSGGWDLYFIKTNMLGDTIWNKTFGGSNNDFGYSGQQTSDGGYISVGTTLSFGAGSYDVYVVKTDPNGNLMWSKTFGGTADDRGQSIRQTNDGGYIIVGTAYSYSWMQFSPDMYVIKIDSLGNVIWSKTFGGFNCYTHGQDIRETNDGGFAIIGYTQCFGDQTLLVKTDSVGNLIWTKGYGGAGTEGGYSIEQTNDNGYIISGLTNSFGAGSSEVYLVKTDSLGNSSCYQTTPSILSTVVTTTVSNPSTVIFSNAQYTYPTIFISSGAIVNSPCLSVGVAQTNALQSKLTIFPNPFSTETTLKTNDNFKNATLTIYNTIGREIKSMKNISTQTITLNRDNLQNGIYFILLTQDDKVIATDKLIIIN